MSQQTAPTSYIGGSGPVTGYTRVLRDDESNRSALRRETVMLSVGLHGDLQGHETGLDALHRPAAREQRSRMVKGYQPWSVWVNTGMIAAGRLQG